MDAGADAPAEGAPLGAGQAEEAPYGIDLHVRVVIPLSGAVARVEAAAWQLALALRAFGRAEELEFLRIQSHQIDHTWSVAQAREM